MGKVNFEEYRQPWETGAHWELKREFIEKYKDDFPEDRLLCLAQAYSNIELLHCSYPDPVMLQINELSKPLQGCKGFREVKRNFPKDGPELQARPPGKRNAQDDFQKSAKFIKFHSAESSQATDGSTTEDVSVNSKIETDSFSIEKTTSAPKTPSSFLNVLSSKPTFPAKTPSSSTEHKLIILSLPKSPDFKLITEIAANLDITSKDAVAEIERIVDLLNIRNLVYYKFIKIKKTKDLWCGLYIKDTLISIGRDSNERMSRINAASLAMEILANVNNLPIKTLNDLKTSDRETLCFLKKFLQEVTKANKANKIPINKINTAALSLKCMSDVTYFSREDHERCMSSRLFYSDLVVKKVLICTCSKTVKKKAKLAAAEQLIPVLVQFFKEFPEDCELNVLDKSSPLCNLEDSVPSKPTSLSTEESVSLSKSFIDNGSSLSQSIHVQFDQPSVKVETRTASSPIANPGYHRINYKLLNNSLQKKFALLDASNIQSYPLKPQTLLGNSAQYCKKNISYDMHYCAIDTDGSYRPHRCEFLFDEEIVEFGVGSTKVEAKDAAAKAALQSLEKQFYTIKVKSELDGNFIVQRNQMMGINVASDAVSDSNVGCKMLKMMGWTGGGLGKKNGGITEPIMATGQSYHQGLGFAGCNNDMKKFRQNIESLLREFSKTNTTSDLIFCTDFSSEERKLIHNVCGKFGLNSNSKGKNEKRQLFVKHKLNVTQLLNALVEAGGCTSKYELVDKST